MAGRDALRPSATKLEKSMGAYRKLFSLPCTVVLLLMAGLPAQPAASQENEPAPPDPGYNVKQLCREACRLYKKHDEDEKARIRDIFQIFHDIYPRATPSEQKSIVVTLRKAFDIRPFPKEALFLRTAAACLSEMGEDGLEALVHGLEQKSLKNWAAYGDAAMECMDLKRTIILAIGFTREPRALKTLYRVLEEDEQTAVKAACQALSCFQFLPLPDKKPIVERLLRRYGEIHTRAMAEEKEEEDRRRKHYEMLIYVEAAFNDALHKMTLSSFDDLPRWQAWYEENKDKAEW
jgi:hypothetical protein